MLLRLGLWCHLLLHFLIKRAYSDIWECDGEEEYSLQQEARPYVWIDSDARCDPSGMVICEQVGLDFNCTSTAGCTDEDVDCQRTLCVAPLAPPLREHTDTNYFQVISYNTYELNYVYEIPIFDLKMYTQTGQRERLCRIAFDVIQSHRYADVIVFEEVFMGGCFPDEMDIRDMLAYYGFPFTTPTVGVDLVDRPLIFENGGVFVASRWPIVDYAEHIFEASDRTTEDAYASKGVMYAHVVKISKRRSANYHVFGTHMQSQVGTKMQTVRELQASEVSEFIESFGIPSTEAVIMAGDFNADMNNFPEHADRVLTNMGAILPTIVGPLRTTWDPITNGLILDSDEPANQWLDYVVLSASHLTSNVNGSLSAFKPQCKPVSVCIEASSDEYVAPTDPDCKETLNIIDLSDHYAVIGSFQFPTDPVPVHNVEEKCCGTRKKTIN